MEASAKLTYDALASALGLDQREIEIKNVVVNPLHQTVTLVLDGPAKSLPGNTVELSYGKFGKLPTIRERES